jgi:hypothetical protein
MTLAPTTPALDVALAARVLEIYARADVQDSLWWNVRDGRIRFFAPCNDLFHWATADLEEITRENVETLEQAERDLAALESLSGGTESVYLSELFAARVRHMRPQRPCYKNFPPGLSALFDACGPERDPKDEG